MKQLAVILILLMLASSAYAADKYGDTHKVKNIKDGVSIYDIKGKNQLIEYYPDLISNTYNCFPICSAEYVLINKVAKNLDLNDVDVEFFQENGSESLIVSDYKVEFVESLSADTSDKSPQYIKPNEPKKIKITATKDVNEFVEWIPIVRLTKDKHDIIDADEIILRNTAWAEWGVLSDITLFYTFDDGDYPTDDVNDTTGNGYTGVTYGGVDVEGFSNNAIKFNGNSDNYINITQQDLIDDTDFSISTWIKLDKYINFAPIIAQRSSTIMVFSTHANGQVWIYIGESPYDIQKSNLNLSIGAWHHVVLTWDGADTEIYVDNVKDTPASSTEGWDGVLDVTQSYLIGNDPQYASRYMNGSLDHFQVYRRALNTTEIAELYNEGSPPLPTITQNTPADTATIESPAAFNCSAAATNGDIVNVTMRVYNSLGNLINSSLDQSGGDNTYLFSGIALENGVYIWNCRACQSGSVFCDETGNYTVTIDTAVSDTGDQAGECQTDYGYLFNMTATTEDYILYDMTALGTYLFNSSMPNLWTPNDAYLYAANQLIVNTTVNKTVTLWLGGYGTSVTHTAATPSEDASHILTISNFTQINPAYIVRIKDESDDSFWDYSDSTSHTLDIYCDNYAADRWDLKNTYNKTTLLITTKERPWFHGILDGSFNRYYDTIADTELVRLYFLINGTTYYNKDFYIEDYTGEFTDSYLRVVRKVNDTLRTITQKQWYGLKVDDISMENNTFAQYIVYTPTNTRIISWDRVVDASDVTIVIEDPTYTDYADWIDGAEIGFTSSYASSSVGISYNITQGDVTSVEFRVYNYSSDDNYQLWQTVTVTNGTRQASISAIVPDPNATYYVTASCQLSRYGNVAISKLVTPASTEERFPYYDSWGLPATIMGLSRDSVYTAASILLITIAAFTFSAGEIGTGGLITAAVVGVTKYFGWFREMTWGLYFFIMAAALIYAFVDGRRKLE